MYARLTTIGNLLRKVRSIAPPTAKVHIERLSNLLKTNLNTVVVANAGLVNSGKSALFNALVDDEEAFETQSIRCTRKNKTYEHKTFELVDTPGLDAEDSDTREAEKIHGAADIVLFIHTVESEYDRQELEYLKNLRNMSSNSEDFIDRVIPVFSKVDKQEAHDLNLLLTKSLRQYSDVAGCDARQYFCVSNPRYFKGSKENRPRMIEQSGIPSITEFLETIAPVTRRKKYENLCRRVANESREIETILRSEKEILSQMLAQSFEEGERKRENLRIKAEELILGIYEAHKDWYALNAQLSRKTQF